MKNRYALPGILAIGVAVGAAVALAVVPLFVGDDASERVTGTGASGPAEAAPATPPEAGGSPAGSAAVRGAVDTTPAASPAPAGEAAGGERPKAASRAAGMVVAMDPETGQLGLPERTAGSLTIEAMQAIARAEAAGLVTVRHADGSESIEHEGRFTDHTIIHIGPDGRRTFECAHGKIGIEQAMRKGRRPAQEVE